jgi:prepilin-type processing-associated H-X9-DG protein/prepilin-type N-terminal cleavage/methylation domain-containing protein
MNCKVVEPLSHFPTQHLHSDRSKSVRSRAFTLMELLVVVVIIGILAALLLPAISRSKQKAQQIQCVSNLHQFGLALQSFIVENHFYPSSIAGTNSDIPGTWRRQLELGGFGSVKLKRKFTGESVWLCPSARWGAFMLKWPSNAAPPASYGYNAYGLGADHTNSLGLSGSLDPGRTAFAHIRESEVVAPSQMMAIGDSLYGDLFFLRGESDEPGERGRAVSRHQGYVNVVFCDGHVESPTMGFVLTNTSDAALVRWNRDHLPHRD